MYRLIKEEGLNVEIVDISKSKDHINELVRIGGKRQIPCLVIDGEALYESKEIMNWLQEHKEELK